MTIGFRAAGAWRAGTTPLAPALPAGLAAGDMMVMFIHAKGFAVLPSTPAGWTQLFTNTEGAVATGIDVGSVRSAAYYRAWQSGDAAPSVTITSANVALGQIRAYTRSLGAWATTIGGFGGDTVSDATLTLATTGVSDITTGDWLIGGAGLPSDADLQSAQAITATGATIGAATERVADGLTTTGNDLAASGADAACTAGTASASAVYTATIAGAASRTGSGGVVRLRESAAVAVSLLVPKRPHKGLVMRGRRQ